MKTSWKQMDPAQRAFAGHVFDALMTRDAILPGIEADADTIARRRNRIGFADLLRYVDAPDTDAGPDAGIEAALAADPKLRADLARLLKRQAAIRFPAVAAASSGDVERREADGAVLTFKPSRKSDEEVYLLIDLPETGISEPHMLIAMLASGGLIKTQLPAAVNHRIQILARTDGPLIRALQNHSAEVFLR